MMPFASIFMKSAFAAASFSASSLQNGYVIGKPVVLRWWKTPWDQDGRPLDGLTTSLNL
jgi:hypothetical protein